MADDKVTLYELPNYGGQSTDISANQEDLTKVLPEGASSIKVGAKAGAWRAFTGITFQGTTANLQAGRTYPSVESMGLDAPVMSMRKA